MVAALIGAAYVRSVDTKMPNEQQWTDMVEFIRRPTKSQNKRLRLAPEQGPLGWQQRLLRSDESSERGYYEACGMMGEPPDNLEEVGCRARTFPRSWRDAAIRALYDDERGGVTCPRCKGLFRKRRELNQLHADHIVASSRGGVTTWHFCRIPSLRESGPVPLRSLLMHSALDGLPPTYLSDEHTSKLRSVTIRAIQKGKAKYPGLHALRHFYASWCINRRANGGLELPLKLVQARLGHSTVDS